MGRSVRIPSAVCRMRAAASSAVSSGSKYRSRTYDLVPHRGTVPPGVVVGTAAASAAIAGGGGAGRRADSAAVAASAVDAATASRRVVDCAGACSCLSVPPAVASGGGGRRRRCEGEDEQRIRCLAIVAMAIGEGAKLGGVWCK